MRAVRNICLAAACCSGASAVALTTGDDLALLQGSLQPEPRALGRQATSDEFKLKRAAQQQQKEKQTAQREARRLQNEKEKAERKAAIADLMKGLKNMHDNVRDQVRKTMAEGHDYAAKVTTKVRNDVNKEIYGEPAGRMDMHKKPFPNRAQRAADKEARQLANARTSVAKAKVATKTEAQAEDVSIDSIMQDVAGDLASGARDFANSAKHMADDVTKNMHKIARQLADGFGIKVEEPPEEKPGAVNVHLASRGSKPFGKPTIDQQEMRRLAAARKRKVAQNADVQSATAAASKADAKAIVSDMDTEESKKWFDDIRKMAGDIVDDLRKAGAGIAKSMGIDKTNKARASEGQEIQARLKQVALNVRRSVAELGNFVALAEA